MKQELLKLGLEEKTFGRYGAKKLFYVDGVDMSAIVALCNTEEKFIEIKKTVMFGRKTNEFVEAVKKAYPTYQIEAKKTASKETNSKVDSIIATINKRFQYADSKLVAEVENILIKIKNSNEANKPKKAKKAKKLSESLKKQMANVNKDELFAFVEMLKKQN